MAVAGAPGAQQPPLAVHLRLIQGSYLAMQSKVATFLLALLVVSAGFLVFIFYASGSLQLAATGQDGGVVVRPASELQYAVLSGDEGKNVTLLSSSPPPVVLHPLQGDTGQDAANNISDSPPPAVLPPPSPPPSPSPPAVTSTQEPRKDASTKTKQCNVSSGEWVPDWRGPLYTGMTCPTVPDFRNCQKYNKDPGYLFWRWQPDGCELPRAEPRRFLEVLKGKKLAFVGDSLARNQMEALLCLLYQAETPTDIYKDEHDKNRAWHFPAHDFTLYVFWTEYFVYCDPIIVNGSETGSFNVHLDRISPFWAAALPTLDIVVISGGNWFFRVNFLFEGGQEIGCVNCHGERGLTDYGVHYAIRRTVWKALETIAESTASNGRGPVVFMRTYAPGHFEEGSWFDGGHCRRKGPLSLAEATSQAGVTLELRDVQVQEAERAARGVSGRAKIRVRVLDVTRAMLLRADGHPGSHMDPHWAKDTSDCLHWCIPGPIDMWNDALLQGILAELPSLSLSESS